MTADSLATSTYWAVIDRPYRSTRAVECITRIIAILFKSSEASRHEKSTHIQSHCLHRRCRCRLDDLRHFRSSARCQNSAVDRGNVEAQLRKVRYEKCPAASHAGSAIQAARRWIPGRSRHHAKWPG